MDKPQISLIEKPNEAPKMIRAEVKATKGVTKLQNLSLDKQSSILRILKRQPKFDIIWFSTFIIFGILCIAFLYDTGWMIYLTVAQLFSYLIVSNLIARGRVLGIWLNILDCFLYGAICLVNGVYGELFKTMVISNAFNIYGIINWSRTNKKADTENSSLKEVEIRGLSKKGIAITLLVLVVGSLVTYFILDAINTTFAYLGAVVFACSTLNKYLSMSRYKESWYINMLGTLISSAMWVAIFIEGVTKNNDWSTLPTLGSYAASMSNNIYGMLCWQKLYRSATVNGGEYLAMRDVKINKIAKIKRKFTHMKWTEATDYIPANATKIKQRINVSTQRGLYH